MKISKKTGNTILNISILAIFATALGIISSNALDCKQGCIITHCVWGDFGGSTEKDCRWLVNRNRSPVSRCVPSAYTSDSLYFGKYCYSNKELTYYILVSCFQECHIPMTRGIDCKEPSDGDPLIGPITMATACGATYPPTGY